MQIHAWSWHFTGKHKEDSFIMHFPSFGSKTYSGHKGKHQCAFNTYIIIVCHTVTNVSDMSHSDILHSSNVSIKQTEPQVCRANSCNCNCCERLIVPTAALPGKWTSVDFFNSIELWCQVQNTSCFSPLQFQPGRFPWKTHKQII